MNRIIYFIMFSICILTVSKTSYLHANNSNFVENKGQIINQNGVFRSDILFATQENNVQVFIGKNSLHYQFTKIINSTPDKIKSLKSNFEQNSEKVSSTIYRIDLELIGANLQPEVIQEQMSGDYENYYNVASRPEGILNVKSYSKITFKNVYNGIDWVLHKKDNGFKYEFIVHPNANVNLVKLKISGADLISITETGELRLKIDTFEVNESKPISLQNNRNIGTKFIKDGDYIKFQVDGYNKNEILVIDPWATYYGGNYYDSGDMVAADNSGNVYLGGQTGSTNNIATSGGHQINYSSDYDCFLVKFNSSGVRQWATYYGGNNTEVGLALTTYGSDYVYLGGYTGSSNNISTPGSHQPNHGGNNEAFLVKFNSNGIRQWGTYYGGPFGDATDALVTDNLGNIYLGGSTSSVINISTPGTHQTTIGSSGTHDAFLVKFNPDGVRQWGTYYGGTQIDIGEDLIVDNLNNIYLAGHTSSTTNISTAGAHQPNIGGGIDAFVAKFNSDGIRQWGTYYGGEYADGNSLVGVITDNSGNVYLTASTQSLNNISTAGAHQFNNSGGSDAFLVKFNSSGIRQWGTYYGGNESDGACDLAIDNLQNIYIAGSTDSEVNISTPGTHQLNLDGASDAFLAKFNTSGICQWGTYYGGNLLDGSYSIACNNSNAIYMSGETNSTTGISTANGHQTNLGGEFDAFLVAFNGNTGTLSINIVSSNIPDKFTLHQNYPNPFNPATKIKFDINKTEFVKLKIYDITGREIASLVNMQLNAGQYEYKWDAANFASGVYFYTINFDDVSLSKRMVLVK